MSGIISAYVVYGCLALARPHECIARTLDACQELAWEQTLKRSLLRPPVCELRWTGF